MAEKVLLIVIDQLRADCVVGGLAQAAPMPNLTALINEATYFKEHYTVTTPCGPSRASLLTGLYAMNHRSVRNGTPLANHHRTVGTQLRSAGLEPMLFGYTDVSTDPSGLHANDPDLKNYEGLAPGFAEMLRLRLETPGSWVGYLKSHGYAVPDNYWDLYKPELDRRTATESDPNGSPIRSPARYANHHSDTAFLTERTIETLSVRESEPWFSLVTYIRPHPPLVAPEPYNTMYAPELLPKPVRNKSFNDLRRSHAFFNVYFNEPSNTGLYRGFNGELQHLSDQHTDELRAVYLGLAAEVDHHIGRLLNYLRSSGQYDDTLIVVTADHGEMLGDQYLWGKVCPQDAALKIPLIIRNPRSPESFGRVVDALTESVDIAPTLADWTNAAPNPAYDGRSLLPLMQGATPPQWRDHIFVEAELGEPDVPTCFQRAWDLPFNHANFAVLRDSQYKYVHFNGGISPLLYDLMADPDETQNLAEQDLHQSTISRLLSKMNDHRMTHADHSLSHMKLTDNGLFNG